MQSALSLSVNKSPTSYSWFRTSTFLDSIMVCAFQAIKSIVVPFFFLFCLFFTWMSDVCIISNILTSNGLVVSCFLQFNFSIPQPRLGYCFRTIRRTFSCKFIDIVSLEKSSTVQLCWWFKTSKIISCSTLIILVSSKDLTCILLLNFNVQIDQWFFVFYF